MSAPLTHGQKAYLAQLSDRAFNLLAAQARGRGEDPAATLGAALDSQFGALGLSLADLLPSAICHLPFPQLTPSAQREAFRHAHVAIATGKLGLRCCSQDDYKRVEAHFLDLLGETGKALNAHLRAETNSRRQVAWKIRKRC